MRSLPKKRAVPISVPQMPVTQSRPRATDESVLRSADTITSSFVLEVMRRLFSIIHYAYCGLRSDVEYNSQRCRLTKLSMRVGGNSYLHIKQLQSTHLDRDNQSCVRRRVVLSPLFVWTAHCLCAWTCGLRAIVASADPSYRGGR